jgi:hypothetical protein
MWNGIVSAGSAIFRGIRERNNIDATDPEETSSERVILPARNG